MQTVRNRNKIKLQYSYVEVADLRIVIAGGTGFIGKMLVEHLCNDGHEIIILTRKNELSTNNVTYVNWLQDGAAPEEEIKWADVFINLAGVSINDGRWTKNHQQLIYESRMKATDELIRIVNHLQKKPSVFINASAIGIYPPSNEQIYTEQSTETDTSFLAKTVKDWEQKAATLEQHHIRVLFMRFGVILGKDEGALPLMVLPYKLLVGGKIGTGKQWVSWVHITDVVRAITYCINENHLKGAINVTAPNPVTMDEFGKTVATVLNRPHWLPVPSFLLKIVLGKKSDLILKGQRVISKRLVEHGFSFQYSQLQLALSDLLKNN